jgi:hypothetical protein
MPFPDEFRRCVVFVGYRLPTGDLSLQGTAFFVARQIEGTSKSFVHLVTARHVIEGIESQAPDGKVIVKANFKDGNAYSIETDVKNWWFHPDESEVDVAVLPFISLRGGEMDFITFGLDSFLTEEARTEYSIGVGDEVYLTGLFYNHHGKKKNIPIVRVGNIAAMPEERVLTRMGFIDAYLIEARSIGGLSGSPVFVGLGLIRAVGGQVTASADPYGTFYLMGLMHGHYDAELPSDEAQTQDDLNRERVNMGIAIVVPSEKILEVINQPMLKKREEELEKDAREELLPTQDSLSEKNTGITFEGFDEALKRASRKISQPESEKKET